MPASNDVSLLFVSYLILIKENFKTKILHKMSNSRYCGEKTKGNFRRNILVRPPDIIVDLRKVCRISRTLEQKKTVKDGQLIRLKWCLGSFDS